MCKNDKEIKGAEVVLRISSRAQINYSHSTCRCWPLEDVELKLTAARARCQKALALSRPAEKFYPTLKFRCDKTTARSISYPSSPPPNSQEAQLLTAKMATTIPGTKRRKISKEAAEVPKSKSTAKAERPQRQPSTSPSVSEDDNESAAEDGQDTQQDGEEGPQKTFKDLV